MYLNYTTDNNMDKKRLNYLIHVQTEISETSYYFLYIPSSIFLCLNLNALYTYRFFIYRFNIMQQVTFSTCGYVEMMFPYHLDTSLRAAHDSRSRSRGWPSSADATASHPSSTWYYLPFRFILTDWRVKLLFEDVPIDRFVSNVWCLM